MLAEFNQGAKLQKARIIDRLDLIKKTFSEISFEHNKTIVERESDYDLLFKRHVANITSIRRSGEKQVKLFRRGMFSFEDRFSMEVLNLQSR